MCSISATSTTNNEELEEAAADDLKKPFTSRQWITIAVFGMTNLFMASMFSLQGPFYPKEVIIFLTFPFTLLSCV